MTPSWRDNIDSMGKKIIQEKEMVKETQNVTRNLTIYVNRKSQKNLFESLNRKLSRKTMKLI